MRAAAAVAAETRDVSCDRGQIDPLAALGDSAGKIAHRLYHAGVARTFEEHGVTGAQQRQQVVFEFTGIRHADDLTVGLGSLESFRGALQFSVAD